MSCCKKYIPKDDESVGEYCSNCYSLTGDVQFESPFTESKSTPKIRFNKFFLLLMGGDLPWFVRQTLLDVFPKIESYFFTSERVNFIHMGQLIIELLLKCGYGEYINSYKGLKTPARVKMVKLFVKDALRGVHSNNKLCKLEDLPYLTPVVGFVDLSKMFVDGHIYSDRKK